MSVTLEDGRLVNTGRFFGFGQLVNSATKHGGQVIFCEDVGLEFGVTPERTTEYEAYKAGRQDHPEVWENYEDIQKIVCCHPEVKFANLPGQEADDVMAILFFQAKAKNPDVEVVIYSGDNDMLQLMSYGAKIARSFKNNDFEFIGSEYLQEKFPDIPQEDIIRYRVLVGDPSDNIPPVVPRLNRKFVKVFIEEWRKTDILKALIRFKDDPNGEKLVEARAKISRNIALMNLTKYREPGKRPELVVYQPRGDRGLLEAYKLTKFRDYLDEYEALRNRA